jgi:thioredoxin reductase (NADPH)
VSASRPSIVDTRRDQIFPVLDTDEIERARRFGDVRRFSTGEALASVGEIGQSVFTISLSLAPALPVLRVLFTRDRKAFRS